jgi:hypothetical protein
MMKSIRMTLALALLCAALSTASLASSMYLVQGIPGRDYATDTDPAFPVDVLLNDEVCSQHGLAFGSIAGPLTFFPGTYNVKVSIANTLVKIGAEQDISAVMTLSATGTPTLLTFTNPLTPVTPNMGRVLFAQAANAPALQVILQNTSTMKLYTFAVKPGALLDAGLPAGSYTIEINQGTTTLVPSTPLNLFSQSVTLLYAVGETSNNTVTLQTRILRDVI